MRAKKITGVILAGGRNSRMGKDKGLLVVDGKKIAERLISALRPNVDEIIIISNGRNYDELDYPVYADIIPNCGPMGGIHTALSLSKTEKNLVVACDMPFVSSTVFRTIIRNAAGSDIAVPEVRGETEPLCALYSARCKNKFEELLALGKWKMKDALHLFRVKRVVFNTNYFTNINTPAEYEKIKKINT